jgi:hypothetical protein
MVLAVMAGLALLAVVLLRPGPAPERPIATVGHAGVATTTTTPVPVPAPTTTTTPKPKVAATRGTTVVRADGGSLTVVNEGSATASSGNNTVIGPPSATVNEGPVTAIGNTADVRIRP